MKAIYEFEQELLTRYDFEPMNEGYNIDDLNEGDRDKLSGMLWVLYEVVENWKANEEFENEEHGTLGKIANEYLSECGQRLIDDFISTIQEFVVSCLDGYAE